MKMRPGATDGFGSKAFLVAVLVFLLIFMIIYVSFHREYVVVTGKCKLLKKPDDFLSDANVIKILSGGNKYRVLAIKYSKNFEYLKIDDDLGNRGWICLGENNYLLADEKRAKENR